MNPIGQFRLQAGHDHSLSGHPIAPSKGVGDNIEAKMSFAPWTGPRMASMFTGLVKDLKMERQNSASNLVFIFSAIDTARPFFDSVSEQVTEAIISVQPYTDRPSSNKQRPLI